MCNYLFNAGLPDKTVSNLGAETSPGIVHDCIPGAWHGSDTQCLLSEQMITDGKDGHGHWVNSHANLESIHCSRC